MATKQEYRPGGGFATDHADKLDLTGGHEDDVAVNVENPPRDKLSLTMHKIRISADGKLAVGGVLVIILLSIFARVF